MLVNKFIAVSMVGCAVMAVAKLHRSDTTVPSGMTRSRYLNVLTSGSAEEQHTGNQIVTLGELACSFPGSPLSPVIAPGQSSAIDCGARSRLLICDGGNFEPLDVTVGSLCDSGQLRGLPGRHIELRGVLKGARVAWLDWPSDEAVSVIATRSITSETAAHIVVHESSDRLIRVSRLGSSPVSIAIGRLASESSVDVPTPQTGGELVLRIPNKGILPTTLNLVGPTGPFNVAVRSGILGLPGIKAGDYFVRPTYEGGIPGSETLAAVVASNSTYIDLPVRDVGRLVVRTADECQPVHSITIARTAGNWTWRHAVEPIGQIRPCSWTFGGLPAGDYQVLLRGPVGSAGSAGVTILAHSTSSVAVQASTAQLSGVLTVNGSAAGGTTLQFSRQGAVNRHPVEVVTAENGAFAANLDSVGRYDLRVITRGQASIVAGAAEVTGPKSRYDWNAGMGTVSISVSGGVTRLVRIVLRGSTGQSLRDIPLGEPLYYERSGLPLGDYEMFAYEPGGPAGPGRLTTALVSASLKQGTPVAHFELTLTQHKGVLRVSPPDAFVGNSMLVASAEQPGELQQIDPGVFALSGAVPGTPIIIRGGDGLSPACTFVPPPDRDATVQLEPGRQVRVTVEGAALSGFPPGLGAVVSDGGCGVPWGAFASSVVSTTPTSTTFVIHNFPVLPQFTWVWRSLGQERSSEVQVDPDGHIVLARGRAVPAR